MSRLENFNFKKNFGQNFIFDENILLKIVESAGITSDDNVLEIGSGAGTLTKILAEKAKNVVSYEIDKTLTEHLQELESQYTNLKIYIKDGLKTPISEIEKNFNGEKYSVIANLPYYITSPLIFKFTEETDKVDSITVMVQREVAERYTSNPNSKEYGIATIMLNYHADTKFLRSVSRKVFTPVPNVDSALIKIVPNKNKQKAKDYDTFKKVVHSAFSMRRKTLSNNLSKNFSISKNEITSLLSNLNKNSSVRAEDLSISDFIYLADNIKLFQTSKDK